MLNLTIQTRELLARALSKEEKTQIIGRYVQFDDPKKSTAIERVKVAGVEILVDFKSTEVGVLNYEGK